MKQVTLLFIAGNLFLLNVVRGQQKSDSIKVKSLLSVEYLAGNHRLFSQVMFNKRIAENPKAGVLNISSFAAAYKSDLKENEYLNYTSLYYKIAKSVSIHAGASFTAIEGLKPLAGLQYSYLAKNISATYLSAYYYTHNHKIFNLLFIEYKPEIKNNWALYSRVQANYQYDVENEAHFRSYIYLRCGLTHKNSTIGLGANEDRYGVKKLFKENYGFFIHLKL